MPASAYFSFLFSFYGLVYYTVIASDSVAIPLKKYAAYTPYFIPRDCRSRYAPSQ